MTPSSLTPQARLVFQDAFDRIKDTVTESDARHFQSTKLQDVRDGALDLETRLGERRALRNMRRIKPFLDGLERYSSAIDVLCNGTPFLPWIWVRPASRQILGNVLKTGTIGSSEIGVGGTYLIAPIENPCSYNLTWQP